ncbi:MAG: CYTH domain-containing protein [Ignavibacteriales bacterium]
MSENFKPEIEKKYLIKNVPFDFTKFPSIEIIQGYISEPGDDLTIRIRKYGNKYFRTLKKKGFESRLESEEEISQDEFDLLWSKTIGKRISKTRYRIPYLEFIIELDVFKDNLDGLVIAEVEFKTLEQSKNFNPPDWFGEDVTFLPKYSNSYLSKFGYQPKQENSIS